MPLSIAEVEADDLPTITDLAFFAFYESNPVERLTYPRGLTISVFTASLASEKRGFLEPGSHYLKIVDSDLANQEGQPPPANYDTSEGLVKGVAKPVGPDSGGLIAYARFQVYREDRKASDWDKPLIIREGDLGAIEDVNLAVAQSLRGQRKEVTRRNIRGRRCVCKFSQKLPFLLPAVLMPPKIKLVSHSPSPTMARNPPITPASPRRYPASRTRQASRPRRESRPLPPGNPDRIPALSQAGLRGRGRFRGGLGCAGGRGREW